MPFYKLSNCAGVLFAAGRFESYDKRHFTLHKESFRYNGSFKLNGFYYSVKYLPHNECFIFYADGTFLNLVVLTASILS